MAPRKTIEDIRRELSDLILAAVPEPDPARRTALLTLADHWSELLQKRRVELEARVSSPTPDRAPPQVVDQEGARQAVRPRTSVAIARRC